MNPLDFPIIKELYDSEKIDFMDAREKLTKLCKENPEFEKITSTVYRYKDFLINIQLNFQILMHAVNLGRLKDLELTCMPKLVAFRFPQEMRDGTDYDMLITEIPGVEKSWPLPFIDTVINDHEVKGLNIRDIPLNSRQRLYDELVGLHDDKEALINVATGSWRDLEGTMLYIPSTETLLISQWSKVIRFANNEIRELYKSQLKGMLQLK